MKEICVVHLVRAQNGLEPFIRFLESYRQNCGGFNHDLLILFKGFDNQRAKSKHIKLLASFDHKTLDVIDKGFDIMAYFSAVNHYSEQYRYFCFLNSFSVILDHDWLNKFYNIISRPNVGLVGATGSWQSLRGNKPLWVLPIQIAFLQYRHYQGHSFLKRIKRTLNEVWRQSYFLIAFDRFPNFHIRTNAFMISGELLQQVKCPKINNKLDTYRFESGSKGLTKQILKIGKKVILVGKNGEGYEKEDWHISNIFWQANQKNLLVADNQTRDYQNGTTQRRAHLQRTAWGGIR